MIFKCRHRFSDLVVYSDSTEKNNKHHYIKEKFWLAVWWLLIK